MNNESYDFPYATAPEIVRANQKDIYVQSLLREKLIAFIEALRLSPRILQNGSFDLSQAIHGLYLCLTTLVGSPTLGEEYCDIFYKTGQGISNSKRRLGFVLTSCLGPLLFERWIIRSISRLANTIKDKDTGILGRILTKISNDVSSQSLITINVALFYFFGKYHEISQRIWGMRYAFGHKINPLSIQNGYEILGVLIMSQLLGKLVIDIYNYSTVLVPEESKSLVSQESRSSDRSESKTLETSEPIHHGPITSQPIIDLSNPKSLSFIPQSSRICTLCLEPMKCPTSTLCGHLFCWSCVTEWCREKPECPLCRQACLEQNLLPIR